MCRPACVVALTAVAAFAAGACNRGGSPTPTTPPHPVADFPEQIDLGERELGEIAVGTFRIANRGGAELVLDQVQSNCSCSGLEQVRGGTTYRVETLRIQPGEVAEVQVRVSVRGMPVGSRATNVINFRTNDPTRPAGRIETVIARVTGGVFTHPDTVLVGTVPVGAKVVHFVDVQDDGIEPRALDRVTSSQPDRITARLIPFPKPGPEAEKPRGGVTIARLEVVVNTERPGEINCALTLHLAGSSRTPDVVRVIGKVVAPIEVTPASLILPRTSPSGPVYDASCLVRSTSGRPLNVTVDSCPPDVTVKIPPPGDEPTPVVVVTVTLDPNATKPGGDATRVVRLRCRCGDEESVVELRVLVAR